GLPNPDARKAIFEIHLKKRKCDPQNFNLDKLAKVAEGYSGSEIEQAVLSGLHEAFASEMPLDTNRLVKCVQASPPISVTMAEHIHELNRWARGRCVLAD
ncbi:MAG: AAA family ATPase, partial [Planctomycetota bacterium]